VWEYVEQELIHEGARFAVYRARRLKDGVSVVLKGAKQSLPSPASDERLRHEYDLLRRIGHTGVACPLELVSTPKAVLVLRDAGPQSLAESLQGGSLAIGPFFDLAIRLAETLGEIHRRDVIHRDLCPENVVLGTEPIIVDFEGATTVPAFSTVAGILGEFEGTLAYMAPEQTGRMNRLVDKRADLYALGAIFYEVLTGSRPFQVEDPLELVQAQLAIMPPAPSAIRPSIPLVVSNLVLKLLSKGPEQRYQTAESLKDDLEEAQRQWRARGTIEMFELGRQDVPYRLIGSGKLHGREREHSRLEQQLRRAAQGHTEVGLVLGAAGVGKSALVNSLQDETQNEFLWLSGKCDLLRGNLPYAAIVDACHGFISSILRGPQVIVSDLRETIRAALSPNGRILTELIPDLERLIGEQPPAPEVGPVEAENRLGAAFSALIRALSTSGCVVLFLDDMQWVDAETLKFLRASAADPQRGSLLILCAYRDEEVGPEHLLSKTVQSIGAAGVPIERLLLGPLDAEATAELVGDFLHSDVSEVRPLASVVFKKTAGNPFFVRRLFSYMVRARMLVFAAAENRWQWDLSRIEGAEVAANVAALLANTLGNQPLASQRALQVASCIGHKFDLDLLAAVQEQSLADTAAALRSALEEGLLVGATDGPRFAWAKKPIELPESPAPSYYFSHDRIQQAAYQMLGEAGQQQLHLAVGRRLLESVPPVRRAEAICPVVDQLDRAAGLLSTEERLWLAQLNYEASLQARAASAYDSALTYCLAGLSLQPEEAWRLHHDVWFPLQRDGAEYARLSGNLSLCAQLVDQGLTHTDSILQKAELYEIVVQMKLLARRYEDAARTGFEGLRMLGVEIPLVDIRTAAREHLSRVRESLARRASLEPLAEPPMGDERDHARLQLLKALVAPSWIAGGDTLLLVSCLAVEIVLRLGHADEESMAYASLAVALTVEGKFSAEAMEFARMALEMVRRQNDPSQESRVLHLAACHVLLWGTNLRECTPLMRRSYELGLQSGEFVYAVHSLGILIFTLYFCGVALDEVLAEADAATAFCRRIAYTDFISALASISQTVRHLKGLTPMPFDWESEQLGRTALRDFSLAWRHTAHLMASYLLGETKLAREHQRAAAKMLDGFGGTSFRVDYTYYAALTALSLAGSVAGDEREALLQESREHLARLTQWAERQPENWAHKRDLVAAELTHLEGRPGEALGLYHHAIEAAANQEFQQDEALGHELLGRFALQQDLRREADLHLAAALEGYVHWGAAAKAARLADEFPRLKSLRPAVSSSPPAREMGTALDLLAKLKLTETLMGELVLDRLLEKMTRICMEAAAARRAVLVLNEGELVIRATAAGSSPTVLEHRPLAGSRDLPVSIVERVFQSGEVIVLADAARDWKLERDPYLAKQAVLSVLAVPLRRQEKTTGVLYFENNLATAAFTPERVEFFRLLSAEMAIAIQNSFLFEERQRAEEALQRAVRAREEFLSIASHELRTPLTALTFAVRGLRDGTLSRSPGENERVFSLAERQIVRLSRLTDELLNVSRMQAGRMTLRLEEVDLAEFTRGICADLGREAERAGCRLELQVPDSVIGYWDREKLEQALINLLVNAFKFGAGKPVEVSIGTEAGSARLTVVDHGIGISKERLPALFQRFERGVSPRDYGGLGLGLFITRSIVEALGGTVSAQSRGLGSGATFVIELPFRGPIPDNREPAAVR
jgi:predicted ATPase/signal transduction histidine kinase/tRNA A-37 threonylcarbamoyl transferase component Bud32